MLTFEDQFHSDGTLGCILWADETVKGRVRFNIGSEILQDVLHGQNPVHEDANITLCENERRRIEAACRKAFATRPNDRVNLHPTDFTQG
jgi:hypothetical protein